MMRWIRIGLLLFFLLKASYATAVQVKLTIPIIVGSVHEVEGLENSTLATSNFGLKFLIPVAPDTLWGLGASLFNARAGDGEGVSPGYESILSAMMFQAGVDYSGIEIFQGYRLVVDLTVEFPINGEGRVEDSNGDKVSEAKSVSGTGLYLGTGVRWGSIEGGLFYKQNDLSYGDLTIPRDPNKEIAIHSSAYGIFLAYLF